MFSAAFLLVFSTLLVLIGSAMLVRRYRAFPSLHRRK